MRLLVRFALLIVICVVSIIIYGYTKLRQNDTLQNDPKTGYYETVRILLMSDESAASAWEANVDVTSNVIVVLTVSLLSLALIVTGIIVATVTLDPSIVSSDEDDADEIANLRRDRTIWTHCPPSTPRQIGVMASLNKYSITSISEI